MDYLKDSLLHYEKWEERNREDPFGILRQTVAYELKPTDAFKTFIKRKGFKKIIDCGCGANALKQEFKGKVISFDIRDIPDIDYVGTFQDVENKIEKKSADFIICRGSISFGKRECIEDCVRIVSEWCQPGCIVYMMTKTDFQYKAKRHNLEYKWSIADVYEWSDKYGFNIRTPVLPIRVGTEAKEGFFLPYNYKDSKVRFQWLWQKI